MNTAATFHTMFMTEASPSYKYDYWGIFPSRRALSAAVVVLHSALLPFLIRSDTAVLPACLD